MLSNYDKWLLPKDSNVPEMDADDETRILLDILWRSFRLEACLNGASEDAVKRWIDATFLQDDDAYEALVDKHRTEMDERWAQEWAEMKENR